MSTAVQRTHRSRLVRTMPHETTKPQAAHRPWRLLVALLLLGAGLWFLPAIVANTPLLHWGLKLATAKLNGTLTVQSVSLGWLSPIAVRGVQINDVEGKPVLQLPAADSDRRLLSLLLNLSNLGQFRLDKPQLSLVLRDDGSNLEDLLAEYLKPSETPSSSKISFSLEIIDGSVSVTDLHTGQSWRVEKLQAGINMPEGPTGPLTAALSAELPDSRRPGKLAAELKMAAGKGEAKLQAAELPLAMFRAPAARFAPGTSCDGRLNSNLLAKWGTEANSTNTLQADLSTESLSLSTPALQTDVLQLQRIQAGCRASWQADRLVIEQSSVDCDLGNVSLASTVRLDVDDRWSAEALLSQRHELSGRLDLARLARLLPASLHLREQVEIDSGQVKFSAGSQPGEKGMKWRAKLDAADLTATAAGRKIAWQQPLSLELDAHETPAGPVVDTLRCESDFLKVHASGTPDALAASLSFNLKQLADQLGQFVDLGGVQLAGEGWGNLNWTRSPKQEFTADAEIRLRNFQLALPDQPPWREDDLVALLAAKGRTDLSVETRIDSATLNVKSAADQLDARLLKPVENLRSGGCWPLQIQMQGQLQGWPGRLAAWLPTKDCRLTGGYSLDVQGTASAESVELGRLQLAAAPLVVASPWVNMNEPSCKIALTGSWNQQQRRLQINPGSLTCATVAIEAQNVVLGMPADKPLDLAGTLKYQGDAARIKQWFADPQKPAGWQIAGQLTGTAQFQQQDGSIRGQATTDLVNLAVSDSSGQQFQEPRITLVARGDYDRKGGVLQLEQLELRSTALAANAAGRVAPVSGVNNAQIEGQIGYDLERVAGLLRPYIGSGVRIIGRGASPAWYRGPFSLAAGQAAAAARWEWANIYGLQIGPGELKAAMADGAVQFQPLDLVVSQGRMHLAPRVRLAPEPMELTLPKGPLLQQIQIDPVMCASMLKYVAPVLADVTTAQGSFSVDLDGCRIPLSEPAAGDMAGQFTVHSIEVGPGPLIRALAVFLGRESPAKLRQQSVVLFRMVGGRVYHQGLELIFPEFTVRTYGWVGLDQTMAIMAEMPVPPKWVENNPTLAQAMRNQVIRVPIGGTLSKPELDKKVMEDLSRQFLQKAAGNLIENELNRQLDRLFGR